METIVNRVSNLLKTEMERRWENGGASKDYPFDTRTPQDKRKKPHALNMALKPNSIYLISPEMNYFELGNPSAERLTPHYHILEDSRIIRMPRKGTEKSRGSQAGVRDRSKRDYSVLGYAQGTTTVVQEYRQQITRNYFGKGTKKTTPREYEKRKAVTNKNKRNYRQNIYFMYIEKLLENIAPFIASSINARLKRERDDVISVGEAI
jgi:hypothetical protein